MADLDQQPSSIPKESAIRALNTIIQLHFDKTLEKKQAVDFQKKQLFTFLHHFFIFLALILLLLVISSHSPKKLHCKHVWVPLGILSLAHLAFYISVAQTLRCVNRFKYQRRCHKLTLVEATDRLRRLRMRGEGTNGVISGEEAMGELEVAYQEPPESYLWKFRRNWALYFGFLFICYSFMVASSFVLLCGE